MKELLAMVVVLIVAVPVPAAGAPEPTEHSGNWFYEICSDARDRARDECISYLIGVLDGWREAMTLVETYDAALAELYYDIVGEEFPESVQDRTEVTEMFALCPPDNNSPAQALDIVMKYLREYPEQRDRGAAFLVRSALSQAWSCQGLPPPLEVEPPLKFELTD